MSIFKIPVKAQDPKTNGDAALIKTGTKQQPNGAWKQQSSTDPKSKGRVLCVKRLKPLCCEEGYEVVDGECVEVDDGDWVDPTDPKPPLASISVMYLPKGGCSGGESLPKCAKTCAGENYGRSMVKRAMTSKNLWIYKATGANAKAYAKQNNRYLFRLDESHCDKKILLAFTGNNITFDAIDATEEQIS